MSDMNRFDLEISRGSSWISLNDYLRYEVNAENTLNSATRSWRTVKAESPVLGGDYIVHAVPGMVTEVVSVRVRGEDHVDMNDNVQFLYQLFEQIDYRIRVTTNDYREYWRCQLAESTTSRGHVLLHNVMTVVDFQVPRYPNTTRERFV